jgi:hypothetical protein
MSISLESPSIPLPAMNSNEGSASSVVPAAGPIPKPQPRPRPRKKGTATEHSCPGEVGVTVEAHDSTIATSASTSAQGGVRAVSPRNIASKNIETAETNHTTKGVALEQHLPGPSADLPPRAGSLKGESKRKAMGIPEATGSSKKMRATRSEAKALTTEKSSIQTRMDTTAESVTAAIDTKANPEIKLRRGRSAAKIG